MVNATATRSALQAQPRRKPAPKPTRTVRLVNPPGPDGTALICIRQGERVTYYRLARLTPGYGDVAFTLKKVASDARYDLLRDAAGCWSCDCADATFRGLPCKHCRALDALLAAGKLS